MLRYKGGNLVVDPDEQDYKKGVEDFKFSVVERIFLQRGNSPQTAIELKSKLGDIWCIQNFKLVPVGGGHYHVILSSMDEQCKVMSFGPINMSPRTFRL